jgi:hypothetical protein
VLCPRETPRRRRRRIDVERRLDDLEARVDEIEWKWSLVLDALRERGFAW